MKKNTIKSIVKFWLIIKEGFKSVFTKKVYKASDNIAPIMKLLQEVDFRDLTVEEMIGNKNLVDSLFSKLLKDKRNKMHHDISLINNFFSQEIREE